MVSDDNATAGDRSMIANRQKSKVRIKSSSVYPYPEILNPVNLFVKRANFVPTVNDRGEYDLSNLCSFDLNRREQRSA